MDVEKKEGGQDRDGRGDAQRPQGDLAAEQVGDHAGGVRRVLQADLPTTPQTPARVIHYTAEGKTEFKVLAFIPAHKPFELQLGGAEAGCKLYIQRVLIMDRCEELLPPYLRFVQRRRRFGRPAAQHLARDAPAEPAAGTDPEERRHERPRSAGGDEERRTTTSTSPFFEELGVDAQGGRRPATGPTARSSPTCCCSSPRRPSAGKFTTLAEYVERMPEGQKDIYYLIGETREIIESSPLPGGVQGQGLGSAAADRPDRRVPAPVPAELQGQAFKPVDRGDTDVPADEAGRGAGGVRRLPDRPQGEAAGGGRRAALEAAEGQRRRAWSPTRRR